MISIANTCNAGENIDETFILWKKWRSALRYANTASSSFAYMTGIFDATFSIKVWQKINAFIAKRPSTLKRRQVKPSKSVLKILSFTQLTVVVFTNERMQGMTSHSCELDVYWTHLWACLPCSMDPWMSWAVSLRYWDPKIRRHMFKKISGKQ